MADIHGYRYRVDWRGRLILQVLARETFPDITHTGTGRWRDATVEDITRTSSLDCTKDWPMFFESPKGGE
jgi:hypothetical protein